MRNEISERLAEAKRTLDSLRADLNESRSEMSWGERDETIDMINRYERRVRDLETQLANAV